ncbi:MAG: hypothetical protein AB1427_08525 [Thermodesulfobacteriota bacterium]
MVWKPWIKTEPVDTPDETVRALYRQTRDISSGLPPDTVRLHSLTPEIAGLIYRLNRMIHDTAGGLTLREQEIAALVVSSLNG